jgi:ribose transport system ATP-binding protein
MESEAYTLQLKGISKRFEGTQALSGVDYAVTRGEVSALVGQNGAGKSTLIKIIAGALQPDAGEIFVDGRRTVHRDPKSAIDSGIAVIYQELDLIPPLNGMRNLFLGAELSTRSGTIDNKTMFAKGNDFLQSMGADIDLRSPVGSLTVAEQQIIAICKAVITGKAKIILMDEPSASLSSRELVNLFALIRNLKRNSITVVYISHRLEEIFTIADTVTVLRDGKRIVTKGIGELSKSQIIEYMIGRSIDGERAGRGHRTVSGSGLILEARGIGWGSALSDISFGVLKGEIFGILGLVGSGREDLAKILYGMVSPTSGELLVKGQPARLGRPAAALARSITYVPSDRRYQGLFMTLSNVLNSGMLSLRTFSDSLSLLNKRRLAKSFEHYRDALRIRVASGKQQVSLLSGGNQQKILIARCLMRESDIIILNEPTRGIDVGTKFEIYNLLAEISRSGKTIIIFSTEVPEVVEICDRVLILKKGTVGKVFEAGDFDQARILDHLLGAEAMPASAGAGGGVSAFPADASG